jgi:hypothetical protein
MIAERGGTIIGTPNPSDIHQAFVPIKGQHEKAHSPEWPVSEGAPANFSLSSLSSLQEVRGNAIR